jgi:thiamine biosynthesis protein ThiC
MSHLKVVNSTDKPSDPLHDQMRAAVETAISNNARAMLLIYETPETDVTLAAIPTLKTVREGLIVMANELLMRSVIESDD